MELKLNTDQVQVETGLGTIDIWQVEGSEIFTIEIFPPNQSEESFEKAEFTNVWSVLETACNMDFVKFTHRPKEWTWEQVCDMEQLAVTAIFEMLSTIQNLEDFKDTKLKDGTPVYESLKVIRNKYNDDYCAYCGCVLDDTNRRQNEHEITICEDCFIHEQAKKRGL